MNLGKLNKQTAELLNTETKKIPVKILSQKGEQSLEEIKEIKFVPEVQAFVIFADGLELSPAPVNETKDDEESF